MEVCIPASTSTSGKSLALGADLPCSILGHIRFILLFYCSTFLLPGVGWGGGVIYRAANHWNMTDVSRFVVRKKSIKICVCKPPSLFSFCSMCLTIRKTTYLVVWLISVGLRGTAMSSMAHSAMEAPLFCLKAHQFILIQVI